MRLLLTGSLYCWSIVAAPVFHRDVEPILSKHCQLCHRPGQIGPMPLITFQQTRPWAKAIREAVITRKMPPWFADPRYGHFRNDPSLTLDEITTLRQWVDSGAAEGPPQPASKPLEWNPAWSIPAPDAEIGMPEPFPIPAGATIEYQHIILPARFKEDRWVQAIEVRPSNRAVVHHAVVYVREPGNPWLKDARPGVPFSFPPTAGNRPARESQAKCDILLVYSPGNSAIIWPAGMAKKIPAGSDLVLQMHYTSLKKPTHDQTRIGLVFAKDPPRKRVLTLQMGNDEFVIPPGDPHYRAQISGTLPNDALLLSFFPHMHLRGSAFEYSMYAADGRFVPLLEVHPYNFFWQLEYQLAEPLPLKAGTRLQFTGWFDNSRNNPLNPDPSAEVRFGEQSWEEMMIGFFDVAVDPDVDKTVFFQRAK